MSADNRSPPVDTVYVVEQDGLPTLRAVFDVHHFHPDEVPLSAISNFISYYLAKPISDSLMSSSIFFSKVNTLWPIFSQFCRSIFSRAHVLFVAVQ